MYSMLCLELLRNVNFLKFSGKRDLRTGNEMAINSKKYMETDKEMDGKIDIERDVEIEDEIYMQTDRRIDTEMDFPFF